MAPGDRLPYLTHAWASKHELELNQRRTELKIHQRFRTAEVHEQQNQRAVQPVLKARDLPRRMDCWRGYRNYPYSQGKRERLDKRAQEHLHTEK